MVSLPNNGFSSLFNIFFGFLGHKGQKAELSMPWPSQGSLQSSLMGNEDVKQHKNPAEN